MPGACHRVRPPGGRRRDRRARVGFEPARRAKLAARTARGRPGPTAPSRKRPRDTGHRTVSGAVARRQQSPLDMQQTRPHKPHATRTGIKLALLAQNDPISSILHTQGELCPVCVANKPSRANCFARRTRRRGDCETTITTAHPQTAITETGGTTATEKRTKYTHFSPAKATPVSVEALPTRAKAMAVSIRRK